MDIAEDEAARLGLIVEVVRYCQRALKHGHPVSPYSRVLREVVHFIWERRGGKSKEQCALFRSKAAVGLRFGSGRLHYDHAVPFRCLRDELLNLPNVTRESVGQILQKDVIVLVTKEEHDRLNKAGFGSRMPDGCTDFRARYDAVKPPIEIVPNSS